MPKSHTFSAGMAWMMALLLGSTMLASQAVEPISKPPIRIEVATRQEGAPVKIAAAKSTSECLFEQISLKNTSASTVTSVTFGVLLHPEGVTNSNPTLVRSPVIPTQIRPGDDRTLDSYLLPVTRAYEEMGCLGQNSATAQGPSEIRAVVGLLRVQFLDGLPWEFDPETRGGFDSSAPSANPDSGNCAESTAGGLSENAEASPTGYFTCASADYCLYCENHVTYCITRQCPMPPGTICGYWNCPFQTCKYVP